MAFSNSAVINYPIEEVFAMFIKTAKRDFPRFDEDNAIGCKVKKKVGTYSVQSADMEIEITDYKKNELYQIKSTNESIVYTSTYEFDAVDEKSTRLTLTEEDKKPGFLPWFNVILQNIAFKGRVKRRFVFFIETLVREIETHQAKLAKNSKSRAEEEEKIRARAEAKKAKEAAKKAEEDAKAAKIAAAKAIAEAKEAAKEAEKAAKEAEERAKSLNEDLEDKVNEVVDHKEATEEVESN